MDKGYALDSHCESRLIIQLANGGQTGLDITNIDLNDAMDLEKLEKNSINCTNLGKYPKRDLSTTSAGRSQCCQPFY